MPVIKEFREEIEEHILMIDDNDPPAKKKRVTVQVLVGCSARQKAAKPKEAIVRVPKSVAQSAKRVR